MGRRLLLTPKGKLLSKGDYWAHRIHACLGGYVLCHLLYRYGLFFFFTNHRNYHDHDMGFHHDPGRSGGQVTKSELEHYMTFAKWFLPHLLLQITGFAFPLPPKRHPDGNRIWPQYRWEALIFCCRCISLSFIAWRRKIHNWTLQEDGSCKSILPAAFCVGLTMILADANSHWYKSHDKGSNYSRTIRDLSAPKWAQYLMSSAQFHASIHCLLTSDRLSVQIAALTVVQVSAFGMTLRRKGFISQKEGVVLYALVLVVGMVVIFDDLLRRSLFNLAICFGNLAAVLRMYFGINKYKIWTSIAIILTYLLQQDMLSDNAIPLSASMNILSWIILLGSCYLKHC